MDDITLIPENGSKKLTATLEELSKPLDEYIKHYNLPSDNILASNGEKAKVLSGFSSAIENLEENKCAESYYLTKFVIASAVGLFDGAINYLWDEIIKSLRGVVSSYDLEYFYSIACQVNSNYKNLNNKDDLCYVSDFDLLSVLKRIGMINDIAFKNLEHIIYYRNHASAAHPNVNELSGIKILSMLEDGIKYAINLNPDTIMVQIRQLLDNVRNNDIPLDDFETICDGLLSLPQARRDDFLLSIFGLYCDLSKDGFILKNVLEISKRIWNYVSEDVKYNIGSKFGYYRKNAATEQKDRVNTFLTEVGGLKYKDDDSKVAEIIDKLGKLRSAHFSFYNFYNEYSYMKDIEQILPDKVIPSAVKELFIKTICMCYAGNGMGYKEGVDENAEIIYKNFIDNFGVNEVKIFLNLFLDEDFTIDLYKSKPIARIKNLCREFKQNIANAKIQSCLDFIINYNSTLDNLKLNSDYKKMLDLI